MSPPRHVRRRNGVRLATVWLAALAVCSAAILVMASAAPGRTLALAGTQAGPQTATEEEARIACGTACHRFPPPDVLPKSAWRDELVRMQLIMDGVPEPAGSMSRAAAMIPLTADMNRLLRYYESQAPDALARPAPWPLPEASGPAFEFSHTHLAGQSRASQFAVANVQLLDLTNRGSMQLVATDMRAGLVLAGPPAGPLEPIAVDIAHPSRVHLVDLDGDGLSDLLVSDLRSFYPADHQMGSIYWLRHRSDGRYAAIRLAEGLGRVADARAADLDGDGDLDIVAAVFGWRQTGHLLLLENRTTDWASPVFVPRVLDTRTGAIDAPIVDLNGDGHPDIVVLFAQEHETVVAFINDGKGNFTTETIYQAPHPNWGSSGIDVADVTGNGRLDVLLTNGDTFDDLILKPYHGITLLENRGSYPFAVRPLAPLPGAHRAVAVDVTGNGRLDVVASAMVAGGGGPLEDELPAVIWLEQLSSGEFARRTIKRGEPYHPTLAVRRDSRGVLHIVAGGFTFGKPLQAPVFLWRTQ